MIIIYENIAYAYIILLSNWTTYYSLSIWVPPLLLQFYLPTKLPLGVSLRGSVG